MKAISIDVTKLDKSAFYVGKKGTYLNLTLFDNRDGVDAYGHSGFVVQDLGKERRMKGEKGEILGNWKELNSGGGGQASAKEDPSDDIPF